MNGDCEDPLEASWASLEAFRRSQSGRVCGGAELERALTLRDEAEEEEEEQETDFIIPELPEGSELELLIHSTWGDPYYVGLNGLEIFAADGAPVPILSIEEDQSTRGLGIVPAFVSASHLIDKAGFLSRDDTRLWLAPFRPRTPLRLLLRFNGPARLAMMRIWNYNKSRVHASRGVRELELRLDSASIFRGEISRADAQDEEDEPHLGDTILFTSDEEILERILANDQFLSQPVELPTSPQLEPAPRPSTGELMRRMRNEVKKEDVMTPLLSASNGTPVIIKATKVEIHLAGNWGGLGAIGLASLRLLGTKGEPLSLTALRATVSLTPAAGAKQIWKALEGPGLSTRSEEQWVASVEAEEGVTLTLRFPSDVALSGLAVWNYNASLESSYSGARLLSLCLDGGPMLGPTELRKAPGNVLFDFVQEITLAELGDEAAISALGAPPPPLCLRGFTYQIQLHSSWGDEFYIGLNGIRFLDAQEEPIPLQIKNLAAYPESVNVLDSVDGDPRSSDKLIEEDTCDTEDPAHMWLAPLLPSQMNRIYVVFDGATAVRAIEIWNYRKTPSRGARDVLALVDDVIVYDGEIPISSPEGPGYLRINMREEESECAE